MQITRMFINIPINRSFSQCSVMHGKYLGRQSKFLNKLMFGNKTKRKWVNMVDVKPDNHSNSIGGIKSPLSHHTVRRMTVLNKIFMKYITDLMSTGEAGAEVLYRNVEVSHVEMAPNFKILNVFWIENVKNPEASSVPIDELLEATALSLRHQLTQLRIIGFVPPIHFVRYKRYDVENEIEKRLATADYGEDYEPTFYLNPGTKTVTYKKKSQDDTKTVENKDSQIPESEFFVNLPQMRNDIFGLDHYKIMTAIKISLNKAKKADEKRKMKIQTHVNTSPNLNEPSEFISNIVTDKEQEEQFNKFLIQRRKTEKLRHKVKYFRFRNKKDFDSEHEVEDDYDTNEYNNNYDEYDEYDECNEYEDDRKK